MPNTLDTSSPEYFAQLARRYANRREKMAPIREAIREVAGYCFEQADLRREAWMKENDGE